MLNLAFYDIDNRNIIYSIKFPTQFKGQENVPILTYHLWNRKGSTLKYLASNIKLYIVNANKQRSNGTNYEGQEIINNSCIEAKSSGIIGEEIIDDNQIDFTSLNNTNYLSIGDIPSNCARKIHFRLKTNQNLLTEEAVFFIKIVYNYKRTTSFQFKLTAKRRFFLNAKFLGEEFI